MHKVENQLSRASKARMEDSGIGDQEDSSDKESSAQISEKHQKTNEVHHDRRSGRQSLDNGAEEGKSIGNELDTESGRNPLHDFAENGNVEEVGKLLDQGKSDVNVQVMILCSKPECSKNCLCIRDQNKCDYEGWTALHFAAREGHIDVVKRLLNVSDANLNVQGFSCGDTPLHVAAGWGRAEIVEELLKPRLGDPRLHVDVNIVNKEGQTALHKAALESPDSSKYLVHGSLDRSTKKCEKFHQKLFQTPMFSGIGAILKSRSSLLKEKHAKGVNEKKVDHYAKVVERLLKQSSYVQLIQGKVPIQGNMRLTIEDACNVQLTIEDAEGRTALDIASKRKNGKVFELLRLKITKEVTDYNEPYYRERQANVDAANAILVGAALIASVTFAAWLQPPLGYTTDYQEQYTNEFPAPPTSNPVYASLEHHPMMEWFWAFNSLSFFCAIGTVIAGAHSVLPFRKSTIKQEVKKLRFNLLLTSTLMALSMVFVLFAFATAGIVVLPPVSRFKDNIFSTIGVGGGLCILLLSRLGWNIFESALAEYVKESYIQL